MARDVNLTSEVWCDLIFEGKNKSYGAYALRQKSSDRHLIALIIVLFACSIVAVGMKIFNKMDRANNGTKNSVREVVVLNKFDLSEPKPEQEFVQQPVKELPLVKSAFKFTEYKIDKNTPDDGEEVRTQEELNKLNGIIYHKDIEGSNDVNAINPKDLDVDVVTGVKQVQKETFTVAEIMPSYPGGSVELMRYLSMNLRYPVADMEMGVQGRVVLRFIVGEDGMIREVEVLKGLSPTCDKEAIRVVKSMPQWIPGRQNGKTVPVYFSLPVKFKLES